MEGNQDQVTTLLASQTSSEAIRRLYDHRKAANPRFSYGKLCQLSGLPSAGLLSDVMSGRRSLPEKHVEGVCRAFVLEGLQADFLKTLVALDDSDSEQRKAELQEHLSSLRKLMVFKRIERPSTWNVVELFKGMELYISLGMFGGDATLEKICAYFHRDDPAWIETTLESWVQHGFAAKNGDVYTGKGHVHFLLGSNPNLYYDYVRYSCQDAANRVATMPPDPAKTVFESVVLTLDKRRVEELVTEVRKKMLEMAFKTESADGDALMRFNIQLYPVQTPL